MNLTEFGKQGLDLILIFNKYIEKKIPSCSDLKVGAFNIYQYNDGITFYRLYLIPKKDYYITVSSPKSNIQMQIDISESDLERFIKEGSHITKQDLIALGFIRNGDLNLYYRNITQSNDKLLIINPENDNEMVFKQEKINGDFVMSPIKGKDCRLTYSELLELLNPKSKL